MNDMGTVREMRVETPGLRGGRALLALRLTGAALLAATAAIHLDLYLTGYRSIPAIGWLFLLQVIVAFALAVPVASSVAGSATASTATSSVQMASQPPPPDREIAASRA